ncbi:hypothetical protein [Mycoplasma todarodis]|uniref:Uncharacterized protein n=1 Tax=Mycoplasma todarodis TaxID=1937191 RepID=A0A4R0XLT7_9MOLU|nr:hypothetical protein [Mycoplasma todarodis]TCG11454.1 hypothetical protein C4B25_01560 [Mycoplasma todarodis]
MTTSIKEKIFGSRITPARVAILGMLLALLVTFKFILGFVPGVEIVSFTFIFVALFLPLIDLVLLVSAFNLLMLAIYGFGTWWFGYWPIFFIDILVSFSLKRVSKNIFFFAFLCFLGGINVGFWYFMMDLAFYDSTYATLNLITAIPINLAEAFTSMFMAILFGRALSRVFQANYHKFWQSEKIFEFKPINNKVLGYIISSILVIGSLSGVGLLLAYNSKFLDWRQQKQSNSNLLPNNYKRDERLISTQDYNDIYKKLNQGDNAVVLVVGKRHWTFIARNSENDTLKSELSNNEFYIAYMKHPDKNLGVFLKQAFLRKTDQQISPNNSSGTPGSVTDFDASPFVYVNGNLSPVGVASLKLRSKDIVELSYNDFGGKFNSRSSTSVVGTYYKNKSFQENKEKNEIWIPITASLGVFAIILIVIWTPNIIKKIKGEKNISEKNN